MLLCGGGAFESIEDDGGGRIYFTKIRVRYEREFGAQSSSGSSLLGIVSLSFQLFCFDSVEGVHDHVFWLRFSRKREGEHVSKRLLSCEILLCALN